MAEQQKGPTPGLSYAVPDGVALWNDDPRLRDLLPPDLLPDAIGATELSALLCDPTRRAQLATCTEALRAELARQEIQTLEEGARDLVTRADLLLHDARPRGRGYRGSPCDSVVIESLLLRYGLGGEAPGTLEDMGRAIGRTRERARQIQKKHEPALRSIRPSWPQLDRALAVALAMAPCSEHDLADELIRQGLTLRRYSLQSLRASAVFAGRHFRLDGAEGVAGLSRTTLAAVRRATRTLASRQGLASLLQISDELVEQGIVASEDEVRADLVLGGSVVWLDEHHVTWPDTRRNRLVNTLRTMLAVHQPVDLVTAQNAISDFWTYRNAGRPATHTALTPPSAEALRAFCSWHPDFVVVNSSGRDALRATTHLDHTTELGVEAALLVELIRSTPDRATDRVTLVEAAEAVGMKSATVSVYLSYHPAFASPAHNVWTVLGTDLSSNVIDFIQQQARTRSRREKHDFATGVSKDGNRWVALAVTSNIRMSGVLLRNWLPSDIGHLRLLTIDGQGDACGTVVYNADSGFTHGLGTYLRRFDVQVGDHLLITADLEWESAQVTHGGMQLLGGPRQRN